MPNTAWTRRLDSESRRAYFYASTEVEPEESSEWETGHTDPVSHVAVEREGGLFG